MVEETYLQQLPASRYEVFEPMTTEAIRFFKDHNRIAFYTWGDKACCLPKGATGATLVGKWIAPEQPGGGAMCLPETEPAGAETAANADTNAPALQLKPGDVLVFEEVIDPETGFQREEIIAAETGKLKDAAPGYRNDVNPRHRHAVRLTEVVADTDPLNGLDITHITWAKEDALPFPLCLSALGPPPDCKFIGYVSIACGNVVLIDHGRTVDEDLDDVPEGDVTACCKDEGILAASHRNAGRYNPALPLFPATVREPPAGNTPAVQALAQNVRQAVAQIRLTGQDENSEAQVWQPQADLLASQADAAHFVTEFDGDGRAHLRFGDGELGRKPKAGMKFHAAYRIGNGTAGNVGAESISHVVFKDSRLDGFNVVRNPMPAQGGMDREPLSEAKLFAPNAFRQDLQRAVIADDYAAIVLREFRQTVQNAVARLRWNGSWYEVWVAVDTFGREQAGQDLLDAIACRLHRYRRIGHDLVVKSAQRVPLAIALRVCVRPDYLRGHVKAELLKVFSNKRLPDDRLGFFHADNLTFGDDVYLSKIVAAAQAVQGVQSVEVTQLQRFGELKNNEIENGLLPLGSLEIARLDNDPNFPENGKLVLDLRGGR
ncbi:MAG: putative baseplate assembly protein [Methylomonas sp.]|nr:MAG: putative baseplate assembly protein [Methylomonas sp.]